MTFKTIREDALKNWYKGLSRTRGEDQLSDDYSTSYLCKWQVECTDANKHCSFLCSLGDWLDNISDVLQDNRLDNLTLEQDDDGKMENALFRYYTRFLLLTSEVIEDFVVLNQRIRNIDKKKKDVSARDLEKGILGDKELHNVSNFINSVCKHKTENDNLHVHNHHLIFEFEDFGHSINNNQIRIGDLLTEQITQETIILMPKLSYFIDVIIAINNKIDQNIMTEPEYKKKLYELFVDDWDNN